MFEWVAWRPSCSSDTDAANKLWLALPMEAPQKMALIDQAVSEKKMFKHCYINSCIVCIESGGDS